MPASEKRIARLFRMLSAPSRVRIVELLKEGPRTVSDMAEALSIRQPAVSQHLRVLRDAGLVEDQREGYWVRYSLNPQAMMDYKQVLDEVCLCGCECCAPVEIQMLEAYRARLLQELAEVEAGIAARRAGGTRRSPPASRAPGP